MSHICLPHLCAQVVQMEQVVLQELDWKLVCPTCATFLPWLAKAADSDRECELLAHVRTTAGHTGSGQGVIVLYTSPPVPV